MRTNKLKLLLFFLILAHLNTHSQEVIKYFSTGELCPNTADGHLVKGNRHFDGKVDIELTLNLRINDQRNKILLDVKLIEQAVSRSTRVIANWTDILVYESLNDKVITSYSWDCGYRNSENERIEKTCIIEKSSQFTYKERLPESGGEVKPFSYNDGKKKTFAGGRESPIKYYTIVADTGTEDISDDRDCGHDGKIIDIVLESLTVNLGEKNNTINLDDKDKTVRIKTYLLEDSGISSSEIVQYVHTEYGKPELIKNVNKNWWSALWQFEKIPNEPYYRIKSRWSGKYLYVKDRKLALSSDEMPLNSWNIMWEIEKNKNPEHFRFKNRFTQSYIYYIGNTLTLKNNPTDWFYATWEMENVKL